MTNVKVIAGSVGLAKSCIDRSEVSERVMNVVKGFDFVDASKVVSQGGAHSVGDSRISLCQ